MKIVLLTQWYLPEPVKLLSDLAESLQEVGHDVTVLTGFPNYPSGELYPNYRLKLWRREIINGIDVVRVPLYPYHGKLSLKRVWNYVSFALAAAFLGPLLLRRPDIVHAYHPPLTIGFPAWLLSRIWRVPFVYEIQDLWPETLHATGMVHQEGALKIIARAAKVVYKCASALRVISPGFKKNLVEKGVPASKIHVISNWVDTNFFCPQEANLQLAREWGFTGKFNLMFAGTMGMAQGLDTVLTAASLVKDLSDVQFVLVGDGADLSRLQEIARANNLDNVVFCGRRPVEEMPLWYALADVLLIHLKDDSLFRITIPHKIFTCMASAKPVLAGVAGDAAAVISSAHAGITCFPGDPHALAAGVRTLYRLPAAERVAMGQNGRRVVCHEFSREILTQQLEAMLKSVTRSA
jgi:glycosyltransferase involved in cell wall biosynthesis